MTQLDALSPDQRAVIQLVLQQGQSYAEIAGLLGIPEANVRARAVAGFVSLVPGSALTADDRAVITDFLLGQLSVSERESARRFLADSPEARFWAIELSSKLSDIAGDSLPAIPERSRPAAAGEGDDEPEEQREPASEDGAEPAAPAPRPRPGRRPDASSEREEPRPRSSRLGGALLIAGLAIVIAAVLIKVLSGGDEAQTAGGESAAATPTATATAQPRELFATPLEAVGKSGAEGAMTVFEQDGQVFFQLQAQKVPNVKKTEAYAIWLVGGAKARRLGYFQDGVQGGQIGAVGPDADDVPNFPQWLTTYERVVVSRDTKRNTKQPGPIILQGVLPAGAA